MRMAKFGAVLAVILLLCGCGDSKPTFNAPEHLAIYDTETDSVLNVRMDKAEIDCLYGDPRYNTYIYLYCDGDLQVSYNEDDKAVMFILASDRWTIGDGIKVGSTAREVVDAYEADVSPSSVGEGFYVVYNRDMERLDISDPDAYTWMTFQTQGENVIKIGLGIKATDE